MNKCQISIESRAPLYSFTTVFSIQCSKRIYFLNLNSNKARANPLELNPRALETIHILDPQNEWLHVYTGGSYALDVKGSGADGIAISLKTPYLWKKQRQLRWRELCHTGSY
ncbi:hypothetical protein NPIL_690131 [Nephila pilipes]|uniref:Uncharacterized protein n=1 Tax=Nephila pilipes TaxID=299642 RepID=A0A8X6P4A1_NEPPI|nr:hypothetical protein NPIL_690131 [Nephila pilipes]